MRSLYIRTLIAAVTFLVVALVVMFAVGDMSAGIVLLAFALVAYFFPWIAKAHIGPDGATFERSHEVESLNVSDPNAPSLERESGGDGANEEEGLDDESDEGPDGA